MNKVNINDKKGFTLLELLIVIAIIAVLSVLLIIVLDPSETLKRARDSQRVNDLATLKTALGIYLTNTSTPALGGVGTSICLGAGAVKVAYSYPYQASAPTCSIANVMMGSDSVTSTGITLGCSYAASSTYTEANGTGWIPVNFVGLSGGSPISNLPVDPVNTVNVSTTPQDTDYMYRYLCQSQSSNSSLPAHAYELAAVLESSLYGPSNPSGLDSKDGALNNNYYQVGSDNNLTPATSTVW